MEEKKFRSERQRKEYEKKVALLMEKLECSEWEAEEIIANDESIDKGGKAPYESNVPTKKGRNNLIGGKTIKKGMDGYKPTKRELKPNETKEALIAEIAEFLEKLSQNGCENVEITNKNRQIAFKCGENNYEFTLVEKRKPKK
jgi:hypothetical protein